jgi:hypothetical protein
MDIALVRRHFFLILITETRILNLKVQSGLLLFSFFVFTLISDYFFGIEYSLGLALKYSFIIMGFSKANGLDNSV